MNNVLEKTVRGPRGEKFLDKLKSVLENNPALKIIQVISNALEGKLLVNDLNDLLIVNFETKEIESLKFCPLVSCDVERSFSQYKSILRDNRKRFTPENLEKYLICYCNK